MSLGRTLSEPQSTPSRPAAGCPCWDDCRRHRAAVRAGPTVLDQLPEQQRAFVMRQAAQIRENFGAAHENAAVFRAALRECAEF
ncbi:hypothetical protein [Streptomyces sp. NBC_01465]|uniref:hypothetical protein n=1 Tax=Streptomyces sp. NBC_01465 TaxID=2903878 RepID=UPI002E3467D4|nr:hypothetical protein [Streptomyces sp. NBC_01465]